MNREEGFTLVELVLALAILTVVAGALAAATVAGLRVHDQTFVAATRVVDEQLGGSYWATDVQSATDVTLTAVCPAPSQASPTPLVSFSFDPTGAGVRGASWYAVPHESDGDQTQLVRVSCGGSGSTIELASPLTDVPAVTCELTDGSASEWSAGGCLDKAVADITAMGLTIRTTAAADTISERITVYMATRRLG